mgnify:CR=1 FL=1
MSNEIQPTKQRSFSITLLLCFLLGWLGVHRYYTGYVGLGILQTLTLGGCGIWSIIDLIAITFDRYKDSSGQPLEDYNKNLGYAVLIVFAILLIISYATAMKS